MSREIKFSFMWQDIKNPSNWMDLKYTLDEVIGGKPYDDMSDNPLTKKFHHNHTREFTGLLDKNGVEIYENDILKFFECNEWVIREVEYLGCAFGCNMNDFYGPAADWQPLYEFDESSFEILGNIHQNPELLKEDAA